MALALPTYTSGLDSTQEDLTSQSSHKALALPTYTRTGHGKILPHSQAKWRWLFPHTLVVWTAHRKILPHSQATRRWLFPHTLGQHMGRSYLTVKPNSAGSSHIH
ncbi:hypothetical protein LSAT2_024315 [Lamellibrachia satsuma]|nr:hypothetical protein LSAT2_024315 [Lamellibrachia satsuma]